MKTSEIQQNEWNNFFNTFSKKHAGWNARVEILNPDIGAQVEAHGLPFGGITYERLKGVNRIEIMVGQKPEDHISHTITNPSKVMFQTINEMAETLEFETSDGTKTILSVHSSLN